MHESHLLDVFVFRLETEATVEMYGMHVVGGSLICGYRPVIVWLLM
jgi:hypothetical protein